MWSFFVRNSKFTIIVVLALSLLGFLSIVGIEKESNPEVDIPVVVISTPFPGASALDVEAFVTNEIEDAVLGLDDVEDVSSSSRTGLSSVVIQFAIGANIDKKLTDTKDAVDLVIPDLPGEALDPTVVNVSFDDTPIKVLSLAGPYDTLRLKRAAEDLKDDLERIPGLTEARIIGGQEREIQLLVNPYALDTFGLSLGQVSQAIRFSDAAIPIGSIERAGEEVSLRLDGALETPADLASVVVGSKGGVPVLLTDVAQIIDGFEQQRAISRLTTSEIEGVNAITVQLFKKSDGNILNIIDAADKKVDAALETYLPEGMTIEVIDDNAQFIRDDLRNLGMSGLQTTLLVTLFILLLLGWREALLAGFAIPLTFFITFIFLVFLGETLNFLTLFSLILSLGILVDAAIVMTEGIYANIKEGYPAQEAATRTIKEFKKPLVSGTVTTVFAFAPMILVSGLIGEFIKTIPVTVSIVLFSALFVALGVIPTLAARFLAETPNTVNPGRIKQLISRIIARIPKTDIPSRIRTKRDKWFDALQQWYKRVLTTFLESKKRRRLFAGALTIAFIGSLALPISGLLKVDMFPTTDLDRIYIDLELPTGTVLAETEKRVAVIESYLSSRPEVTSFLVSAGAGSSITGSSATHIGSATVVLGERKYRKDSRELVEEYEAALKPQLFPDKLTVQQLGSGPEQGFPVEVEIVGNDFVVLEKLAFDIQAIVQDIEGVRNVQTSLESSAGELVFKLDRVKLGHAGLSATDVAATLRTAVFGSDVIEMRIGSDDIDVAIKYDLGQDARANNKDIALARIAAMTLATPKGDLPLDAFVTIQQEQSRPLIQHEDGDRIVRVLSGVKAGVIPQVIFQSIEERLPEVQVPPGYEVRLGGQNEDTDQSFADLGKSMILGIMMIAALLVWQFNSYRQPLYVISSIPLAMIGVLPGLWLVGQPLSFPGMIGIVALAGIVVNNGIILVEKINENRKQNNCVKHAIQHAAVTRLRPILLTTITTVLGLLPLVISQPGWAPLGFSIIFGLLFSTVLTLLSLPMLYMGFTKQK